MKPSNLISRQKSPASARPSTVVPPIFSRIWRLTLIAALLAGAIATVIPIAKAADALPTDKVFAADSFWYAAIPKDVELHPNNEAFVGEFLRQKKAYYGHVNINTTKWASPVYVVGPDVPVTRVTEWDCQKKNFTDQNLAQQWKAVPMPDDAQEADGNDSEMTPFFSRQAPPL